MNDLGHDAQPQQSVALPDAAEVPRSNGNGIRGQSPTAGEEENHNQSPCLKMIRTLKFAHVGLQKVLG
jgi:hypothetical protein